MSGDVDLAEYQRRATANRPVGLDGQRIAARELARQGLRELDIASALSLSIEAVRTLLRPTDTAHETTSRAPCPESRETQSQATQGADASRARLASCARGLRDAGSTPEHIAQVLRLSQDEVLELLSDDGTTEERQ